MSTQDTREEAVHLLQQLGLRENEARCFVGLAHVQAATAKQLSDLTEVHRTQVYDAVRVLENKGLVEVQHTSPRQFRAVSQKEASRTLRDQHDDRIERLNAALSTVGPDDGQTPVQEVWSIEGRDAIEARTCERIDAATEEVVLVGAHPSVWTDHLLDMLGTVADADGIDVILGTSTESLQDRVQEAVTGATTFRSAHEWLQGRTPGVGDVGIGRLLMVDRSDLLVSSLVYDTGNEQAIIGTGFGNGLLVLARRVLTHGLPFADEGVTAPGRWIID